MAGLKPNTSLKTYQDFIHQVYSPKNQRHFSAEEMLTNINRFSMRALKGIRKGDREKTTINGVIAMSWFISLMSQFSIDIEESVWKRFPYRCSYCGECPCACKVKKIQRRLKIMIDSKLHPRSIRGFQKMFNDIYPASHRTLEHAGIHLAEEVGELSEAVLCFRGRHTEEDFNKVILESSDLYSCMMAIFNSIEFDYEGELVKMFSNGCHVCHHTPCICEYNFVINYRS